MADVQVEMRQLDEQDKGRKEGKTGEQQSAEGVDSEQQEEKALLQWLQQQAKDNFVQTLPSFNSIDINDLKARGLALWIAAAHLALYLTVGLYFISTVTSREYGRMFLSLTADVSSLCEKIPVAVTGTYLADRSGMWETSKAFDAANPLYQLTLTGTKTTEEQYTKVTQNFTAQLQAYGSKTASLNIIGSQIAWALFRASDASSVMKLETTAQLGQIFANIDISGAIPVFSSVEGVCQNPALTRPTFDPSTLQLTVTVPDHPAPTLRYEFCPDQISVGNSTFTLDTSSTHSFDIDLISVATAFALNFGIIDTSSLTKLNSGDWDLGREVGVVHEEDWIDNNYPQMKPVFCYSKAGQSRACFAYHEHTLTFPVTYNIDYDTRQACLCPQDARKGNCNYGNAFQIALIFSKDKSTKTIVRAGLALQRMMKAGPDGPSAVTDLVSGLAWTATLLYGNATRYDEWKSGKAFVTTNVHVKNFQTYDQFVDGFKTLGPGVSIISIDLNYNGAYSNLNAEGVSIFSLATSHFNFSDGNGYNNTLDQVMCTDTIFQSQALQQMSLAPPVPVIQPYLSCHPTLNSAFVTAAGIAAANSALVSSIFLVLAVFLTVQYFNNFSNGGGSKKIIPPADKALRAAETEKMLLANDDKLFADNARLRAEVNALTSKLAAIEAHLLLQPIPSLSQQGLPPLSSTLAPPPPPPAVSATDEAVSPLHRPLGPAVLPAARLSPTAASAAPAQATAEEQTNR